MFARLTVLLLFTASAALAEPNVTAPASAGIGSEVAVTVSAAVPD